MTLEESALSSLSKYASSSLSESRQLIRSLRGTAVTLWMAARQAAVLSDRELATPRCQLATHRLGPRRGNPCDVAQQLESIVPGDNQLRRFIPSGADTRTDECARHRPRLRRRDTSRGSHWNKRRPEAVLPVGRRGCPLQQGQSRSANVLVAPHGRIVRPDHRCRLRKRLLDTAHRSFTHTRSHARQGDIGGCDSSRRRRARHRAYAPAELDVAVGTSVTWTCNDSGRPHSGLRRRLGIQESSRLAEVLRHIRNGRHVPLSLSIRPGRVGRVTVR